MDRTSAVARPLTFELTLSRTNAILHSVVVARAERIPCRPSRRADLWSGAGHRTGHHTSERRAGDAVLSAVRWDVRDLDPRGPARRRPLCWLRDRRARRV